MKENDLIFYNDIYKLLGKKGFIILEGIINKEIERKKKERINNIFAEFDERNIKGDFKWLLKV